MDVEPTQPVWDFRDAPGVQSHQRMWDTSFILET